MGLQTDSKTIQLAPPTMPGLRSLPHSVGSVEIQKQRVLARLREKSTPLDQYEVRPIQSLNTKLYSYYRP